MIRYFIIAGAFSLAAAPALAAVPPPTYDWTGGHVGVHLGYAWGHEDWNQTYSSLALALDYAAKPVEPDGVAAGIQAGYDHQFNQWVLGVGGDWTWTDLKASRGHEVFPSYAGRSNTDWTGTLTARAGGAFARSLFYVTGGAAFEHEASLITFDGVQTSDEPGVTRTGWTVGVGMETALPRNWSLGLEYQHMGFGTHEAVFTYTAHPAGLVEDWKLKTDIDVVKLRLNYRFPAH